MTVLGEHFELCFGDPSDDPASWLVIARLGSDEFGGPIVELQPDTQELRETALRLIQNALDPSGNHTFIAMVGEGGLPQFSWQSSLARTCGSTANWYGDWHWRSRKWQPGATSGSFAAMHLRLRPLATHDAVPSPAWRERACFVLHADGRLNGGSLVAFDHWLEALARAHGGAVLDRQRGVFSYLPPGEEEKPVVVAQPLPARLPEEDELEPLARAALAGDVDARHSLARAASLSFAAAPLKRIVHALALEGGPAAQEATWLLVPHAKLRDHQIEHAAKAERCVLAREIVAYWQRLDDAAMRAQDKAEAEARKVAANVAAKEEAARAEASAAVVAPPSVAQPANPAATSVVRVGDAGPVTVSARSDKGAEQSCNEDTAIAFGWTAAQPGTPQRLKGTDAWHFDCRVEGTVALLVCNGQGGGGSGDISCAWIAEACAEVFTSLGRAPTNEGELAQQVGGASKRMFERGQDHRSGDVGVVLISPESIQWTHLGTGRVYLAREGRTWMLTRDYTLENAYADQGVPSEHLSVFRSIKTCAFGRPDEAGAFAPAHEGRMARAVGDRVLVTTRSIDVLSFERIADALTASTAVEASERLLEWARAADGADDCTVFVADL